MAKETKLIVWENKRHFENPGQKLNIPEKFASLNFVFIYTHIEYC